MAKMALLPLLMLAIARQIEGITEVQIGDQPICWGATQNGDLLVPQAGTVISVRLQYVSGGFTCDVSPTTEVRWACAGTTDPLQLQTGIRGTDGVATAMPTTATPGYTEIDPLVGTYTLTDFSQTSNELIFNGPSYRVNVGDTTYLQFIGSPVNFGTQCVNVFFTYADAPSASESESVSPVLIPASESESSSESVSPVAVVPSESESTSPAAAVVNSPSESESSSISERSSESQSESESPIAPQLPSDSESTSEIATESPSGFPSNSPVESPSQAASASPAASQSGVNFSILPTSRQRSASQPVVSNRPSRSPPKRRSASPVVSTGPRVSKTKASPARKPSPENEHNHEGDQNRNRSPSGRRAQTSPTRPSPARKEGGGRGRDDAAPSPHNAFGYAASIGNLETAESTVTTTQDSSNAALYGLFALVPVVGVAAFAAFRFSRKAPEVVDFDKAAEIA